MSSSLPTPDAITPPANYAAATQTLRTTVRWLLMAAAGVGGLLVAGLQLTSVGSLGWTEWPRLLAALVGVAVALYGVGYMISRASRILTDDWINLAELSLADFQAKLRSSETTRDLMDELEVYKNELYAHVAEDVPDLYARLIDANEAARREQNPDPDQAKNSADLRAAAGIVVQYANYYATRQKFKTLRGELACAAGGVAAGVLLFAYAANPPDPAEPSLRFEIDLRPTSPSTRPTPNATASSTATPSPSPTNR